MSLKDFLRQQQSGLEAMSNVGVIGLHLVSGPVVGFAIGYGLDVWLGTAPWGKLVFLFIGIGAGFLNVYRDTQALLRRMAVQDARARASLVKDKEIQEHQESEAQNMAGKHDARP